MAENLIILKEFILKIFSRKNPHRLSYLDEYRYHLVVPRNETLLFHLICLLFIIILHLLF